MHAMSLERSSRRDCLPVVPAVPGGSSSRLQTTMGNAVWPAVPVPFSGVLHSPGRLLRMDRWDGFPVTIPANVQNVTIRVGPQAGVHRISIYLGVPHKVLNHLSDRPPRFWKGNMCGIRVVGAEAVPGGAADPRLFSRGFYDRYSATTRAAIRASWKGKDCHMSHLLARLTSYLDRRLSSSRDVYELIKMGSPLRVLVGKAYVVS